MLYGNDTYADEHSNDGDTIVYHGLMDQAKINITDYSLTFTRELYLFTSCWLISDSGMVIFQNITNINFVMFHITNL